MRLTDPTAALPLHFTFETAVLAAAGLVCAWAILRRHWVAAASAAAIGVAQGLHAGQYIGAEDAPILVALRIAGIAGLGATVLPSGTRRATFAAGIGALAAGTVWGTVVGGDAGDMSLVGHGMLAVGSVALLLWVWHASRPSVRLRVLTAFVAVLAVAVVVAGGAVARAAALSARTEIYTRLGRQAGTVHENVRETQEELRRRAAALSPRISVQMAEGAVSFDRSMVFAGEWVIATDGDGVRLDAVVGASTTLPYSPGGFAATETFDRARSGEVVTGADVVSNDLVILGAAPVYRAGSEQRPDDVVGVVVAGRSRSPDAFRGLIADPGVEIAFRDSEGVTSTRAGLLREPVDAPAGGVSFVQLEGARDRWFGGLVRLRGSDVSAVVAASDAAVVEAATDLVRAFLTAILAAALLAIIAALWLSERLMRPMIDLADEAERVKTEFLASVSHELRTPLTPIRGYTEILRAGRVPVRDASEYLDEIGEATRRLERIVALLVDVAALEAQRFRVDVQEVSPSALLTEAARRWRGRAARGAIRVLAGRGLPEVSADPAAVGRVLDELIDNALKFGGGKGVEMRAKKVGRGVALSVGDKGPGMDPDVAAMATEAFAQAEYGDSRRFGGLGLGLTFSRGVLGLHGTRLVIDSKPGEGTTCSFVLPATGSVSRMPREVASRKR